MKAHTLTAGISFILVCSAAVLTVFYFLRTPLGQNVAKGFEAGLIFHPKAYTDALFGSHDQPSQLNNIKLPEGFNITVFCDDIANARSMVRGSRGTIFVGTRTDDKVYAVTDENEDYVADTVHIIAEDLNMPNGVAFKAGALYVAEVSRILKFDDIENRLTDPPEPDVFFEDFPRNTHHGWKYIAWGPDDRLYVPVGAPCNVCDPQEPFASITRLNKDGSGYEIYARGVRNTVGFDWHPETGQLWFTDNGRDWLGDNKPPDELNRLSEKGQHFGFPFCHGHGIQDPEYKDRTCDSFQQPAIELGPHVAALGMIFYTGDMFPEQYRNSIFIAEHGSWNRTEPIGYRVTNVKLKDGKAVSYSVFAEGWRHNDNTWGRPVDIIQMPDGSILVSDDFSGTIYRISYDGNNNQQTEKEMT
jgi:glucose/arabinose dehydrogenase